jgi:hypothetical protein
MHSRGRLVTRPAGWSRPMEGFSQAYVLGRDTLAAGVNRPNRIQRSPPQHPHG